MVQQLADDSKRSCAICGYAADYYIDSHRLNLCETHAQNLEDGVPWTLDDPPQLASRYMRSDSRFRVVR